MMNTSRSGRRGVRLLVRGTLLAGLVLLQGVTVQDSASAASVSCRSVISSQVYAGGYVTITHSAICTDSVSSLVTQGVIVANGFVFSDGKKCSDTSKCTYTWRIRDAAGTQTYCPAASTTYKEHWYSFAKSGTNYVGGCIKY